jgi:hypothetical protein
LKNSKSWLKFHSLAVFILERKDSVNVAALPLSLEKA